MRRKMACGSGPEERRGFSLIEVLVGMALVAIALMGLMQLFLISIINNNRSDQITNAVFLARQQIELLRGLTSTEIANISASELDQVVDVNGDGTLDYHRITDISHDNISWTVRVLVFGAAKIGVSRDELLSDPGGHRVRADIQTVITR